MFEYIVLEFYHLVICCTHVIVYHVSEEKNGDCKKSLLVHLSIHLDFVDAETQKPLNWFAPSQVLWICHSL